MSAVSQAAKDRQAKTRKELRKMYRDHGICPRCQSWAEPGRVYCRSCMKKIRAKQDQRDPTGEQRKAYNRERRARLKAASMCINCGKQSAIPGQVLCKVCKAKNAESQKKYKIIKRIEREAEKARRANNTNGNHNHII